MYWTVDLLGKHILIDKSFPLSFLSSKHDISLLYHMYTSGFRLHFPVEMVLDFIGTVHFQIVVSKKYI